MHTETTGLKSTPGKLKAVAEACLAPGCSRPGFSLGLCAAHYRRHERLKKGTGKSPVAGQVRVYAVPKKTRLTDLAIDLAEAEEDSEFHRLLKVLLTTAQRIRKGRKR